MMLAHDLYAETNPAFCTYVLVEFLKAFAEVDENGADLPLAYLALSIALSEDLAGSFEGTNKKTGLLQWLERTPQMSVGLAERVNASLEIVTPAMRYGCFTDVLVLRSDGRLNLGGATLKATEINKLDEISARAIRRAGRLGTWFATAGSTRNIFGILGLTV
jgi:Family of unknown function (DUF6521)